jgi:hypothetical protein
MSLAEKLKESLHLIPCTLLILLVFVVLPMGWATATQCAAWGALGSLAKGMKVLPPSPELQAGLKKVGEQLTADWIAKAGPAGKAVVDAYKQ